MTARQPCVIVAGLGRCGSSLTMQMLAAGGIPTVGAFPAFEVGEAMRPQVSGEALRAGHAFKLLDPHHHRVPVDSHVVVIWLDRNPEQQAKSQAKFAHVLAGVPKATSAHLRRMASGLRAERPHAIRALGARVMLSLQFESIIKDPRRAAVAIEQFLRPWFSTDLDRMADAVRPRLPECAPDLSIEMALVQSVEAAAV